MRRIWRFAGFLLPLAVWWGAAALLDVTVALPAPGIVLLQTARLLVTPAFIQEVLVTALRGLGALGAATVVAIPLGMLAARSEAVRDLLAPSVIVVRAVPFISIILVAVIWLSSGTVPVFVAFLMVFPLLYESAFTGVQGVDPKLEEMTRAFGFSRWSRVRHLWIPGSAHTVIGGIRAANGIAWKVTVAAEVLSVPSRGIGTQMGEARLYLETEGVFAWTVVLIVLAGVTDKAIQLIGRRRRSAPVVPRAVIEREIGADPAGAVAGTGGNAAAEVEAAPPMPSPEPAIPIELRDIGFSWERSETPLFDNFTVTFDAGEVTAFIGPSGVGKTTLLRLLAGLLSTQQGAVTVPPGITCAPAIVFQEPRLLPWRRVSTNVALVRLGSRGAGAVDRGPARGDADRGGKAALRTVNLEGAAGQFPDELSGGMQQRVALARALHAQPGVLLIDEPLSGIDQAHRAELSEYLRSVITASRVTTVISSHDLAFVYAVADRILLLEERPARIVLDRRRSGDRWSEATRGEIEDRLLGSRHTL
ncbi:MAG: ATP-binding cassette domain-containing protein [Spirochaeta sp.]|jgi:NitT/TauT family transport system permease protein|nr:ATP-binding cassette domain-containing protein [Spirochaeta sp.]